MVVWKVLLKMRSRKYLHSGTSKFPRNTVVRISSIARSIMKSATPGRELSQRE
jgi:hypothetical protein